MPSNDPTNDTNRASDSAAPRKRIVLVAREKHRIERVLEALMPDYDVEIVPGDDAAIESAYQCGPDLFICSLNAGEVGSVDLARRVRLDDCLADIPFIYLADSDDTQSVLNGLDAGADEYVFEPFSPGDLLARVRMQLALSTSRGAAARRSHILRSEAETLNDVAQNLATELDIDRLVQRVTDAGTALTGAEFGAFFRTAKDERGERLVLFTLTGADREDFEKFGIPRNTELFAPTFEGTDVVRIADVREDPRYGKNAPHHGLPEGHLPVRSYLAAPVVSRSGETIGGLFFGHPEVGVFTARSERLVLGLAAQAAVALDNASLYRQSRLEAEERARAEADRALLAAIVYSSDDAIISKTLEGEITTWNEGAQRLFGYTAEEAIGQHITMLIPADRDDEEVDILSRVARGEHIDHFETVRVTKDDRLIDVSLSVSAVRDSRGNIIGASKIARDITRQRAAERALAESERRYRQLMDALPVGVYHCDRDGRLTLYNDAAVELWGRTPVLEGDRWCGAYRLLRPDGSLLPHEECPMALCLRDNRPARDVEVIIERPDGALRHVLQHVDPLHNAFGHLVGAINVLVDITDRKRAEADLRESDRQIIAILEGLPQLIWTCQPDGECDFLSKQWIAYTGVSLEEQLGNRWLDVVHADDRDRVWNAWSTAVERARQGQDARYHLEYRVRGQDGLYRWFSATASPLRDETGAVVKWVGSNTNIQDIRDAEAALRYSEEKFRNLADNMSQFAWMADENWWIYWYNRRWFDYTGTTLADMQGWGWTKVHHPEHVDRVVASVKDAWRSGERWEDVFPLRSKEGEYRWFLSRAEPIRDESGRVVRWFGTNTDITKQRQVEADLKEAIERAEAASQAKDRFLAILSHELRTPLTPVLMLASSLGNDHTLPDTVRRDAAMIRDNIRLETKLIDDLLDLSRITAGKLGLQPENVDLNESLISVCEMCGEQFREKSIRLHCDLDENVHIVTADPSRLQQIFWNVLKNAAKFTPEGGDIYVSTRDVGNGLYRIEIRDTGVGIDPQNLSSIFDAFDQGEDKSARQFGGLGLGLAISKALVEFHHGAIRAESDGLGNGASFIIELPSARSSAELVPVNLPPQQRHSPKTARLLVVEDHEGTATTLERVLKSFGYNVSLVNSKAAAIEFAADNKFDVLISDIGLPDGTGYELVTELKRNRKISAIAISGYGMDEDIRKSRDAGFDEHLVKPLDIAQLEQAIRNVERAAV